MTHDEGHRARKLVQDKADLWLREHFSDETAWGLVQETA